MAAGWREFAFVGVGIYDTRYPHPKKIATKSFVTILVRFKGLLSRIENLL